MFDVMAYCHGIFCTINGEESFTEILSPDPDPDHLRGGPSYGDNTSCVKNRVNLSDTFENVKSQLFAYFSL